MIEACPVQALSAVMEKPPSGGFSINMTHSCLFDKQTAWCMNKVYITS
ncbi:hypothetical protein NT01EI_2404 [Edwardsiella ictaluri 93-146]|uniref:Uncharacterized protein n=1 Tax=Edwardsiella ictaluri (strain 93-146) TaxID=634503 RepID=C5BA94_EDWI9|nr:hypothetical protein NT01EI_2404 [Edwardsiella ictaluri 93-146]